MAPPPTPPPASSAPTPPDDEDKWPKPTLTLRLDDLAHEGTKLFLKALPDPPTDLRMAVVAALRGLYREPEKAVKHVEEVLFVVRPMDGVAYTTGTHTHKQIHLNSQHVVNSSSRLRDEIMGVLVHEAVHCFQHNARGTAPGGLIEGIADFVRLRAGLAPPHWAPGKRSDKWDAGYGTTALFLDWIETRYGDGTIAELNAALDDKEWDEKLFKELTGRKVEKLWGKYLDEVESGGRASLGIHARRREEVERRESTGTSTIM
ncbi:unnamed protein product [Peniophora sp. CBMAI 1063]|nr:unnamed protein product [Peniophora sp. CBMAI 1063]